MPAVPQKKTVAILARGFLLNTLVFAAAQLFEPHADTFNSDAEGSGSSEAAFLEYWQGQLNNDDKCVTSNNRQPPCCTHPGPHPDRRLERFLECCKRCVERWTRGGKHLEDGTTTVYDYSPTTKVGLKEKVAAEKVTS